MPKLKRFPLAVALVLMPALHVHAAELKPNVAELVEVTFPTAGGCNVSDQIPKDQLARIQDVLTKSNANSTWLGACVDGLAEGPGLMVTENYGVREAKQVRHKGRAVGSSYHDLYDPTGKFYSQMSMYHWQDQFYSLTEGKSKASEPGFYRYSGLLKLVGQENLEDPRLVTVFEMTVSIKPAMACGGDEGQRCITRDNRRGFELLKHEVFPCSDQCDDLWGKLTAPMLAAMKIEVTRANPEIQKIIDASAPEVAAQQASIEKAKKQYEKRRAKSQAVAKKQEDELAKTLKSVNDMIAAENLRNKAYQEQQTKDEAAAAARRAAGNEQSDVSKTFLAILNIIGRAAETYIEFEEAKAQSAAAAAAAASGSQNELLRDWAPVTTAAINGTPYLSVCIRDHACEDGDILRVTVNGSQLMQKEIFNTPYCKNAEVRPGPNKVFVLAVNGTGNKGNCDPPPGVNTGEISVSGINRDGSSRPQQTQSWKLTAGAGSVSSVEIIVD